MSCNLTLVVRLCLYSQDKRLSEEGRPIKEEATKYVRSWRGFEEILSHEYHKKNKLRLGKGGFGKGV